MYGLVNKAVESLVTSRFGPDTWSQVKRRADLQDDVFVASEPYPDDITYRLVAETSGVTGVPAAEILHALGRHWALHTAREGYPDLMAAGGRTLPDFLLNLPMFHRRVRLILPKLDPPRFEVTDSTPTSLHLHYRTHRPGLAPFVIGLLDGLGQMFNTPVTVVHVQSKDQGADHDIFSVSWSRTATTGGGSSD